ncbi:hypothetical protein Bhyg_00450 [Pseudolycoriella hygida]|uniref:Nodule Cysteine-Rich (NCR) secreted peptide n=1 Tax=Pseudolycoriella hygida TaxID=35572 RepID=A0A9Q0N8X1_9DIPT|nr:hypothetical protein Bhyg_00450 [Pseudolycoriella hygida]
MKYLWILNIFLFAIFINFASAVKCWKRSPNLIPTLCECSEGADDGNCVYDTRLKCEEFYCLGKIASADPIHP